MRIMSYQQESISGCLPFYFLLIICGLCNIYKMTALSLTMSADVQVSELYLNPINM